MKKKRKKILPKISGSLITGIAVIFGIYTGVIAFNHPELTGTQVLIQAIKDFYGVAVFFIGNV